MKECFKITQNLTQFTDSNTEETYRLVLVEDESGKQYTGIRHYDKANGLVDELIFTDETKEWLKNNL